ncbi:MAG: sulfatase [Eubacteriales bacterium]|nr:sulfatase [Eubacteriales bacterium]
MSKHPNILFVFSDQQRFSDLGCYGSSEVITPNIDKWAQQAVVFDRFYSNCPVCVPARGTLLTGTYPLRHGAITNDLRIRPDSRSIAHILNENGYNTAYFGKWHLGGVPRDQFITAENRLGFDYWRGSNCNHNYMKSYYDDNDDVRHYTEGYEPHIQTGLAEEYIASADTDRPFAMFLSFGTPHDPYDLVPAETKALYDPESFILRDNVTFPVMRSPSIRFDETALRGQIQGYYAHITELDSMMGRLIAALDGRGLREDTVIVYTSDHGNMLGSHGLTDKQLPHEESVHIPFIVSYGNKLRAGRRSGIASLVDIAPTLLSLAGIDISGERCDGCDASDIVNGTADGGFAYLTEYIPCHQASLRGSGEWRALVSGSCKLVRSPGAGGIWQNELYDLAADPFELRDLAEDGAYAHILESLVRKLGSLVEKHDGYLDWQQFIRQNRLISEWNESQRYFGLEEME